MKSDLFLMPSNSFSLDVAVQAHAGNYAVKATNAGGEAQCSADVAVWEALPEELMDQQQRDVIFRELMDFPAVVSGHTSFNFEYKFSKQNAVMVYMKPCRLIVAQERYTIGIFLFF